jgi:hypothetical protein
MMRPVRNQVTLCGEMMPPLRAATQSRLSRPQGDPRLNPVRRHGAFQPDTISAEGARWTL